MMGNVAGVSQLLETTGTPVAAMTNITNGTATPHTDDFAAAMQQANDDAGHSTVPRATATPSQPSSPAETPKDAADATAVKPTAASTALAPSVPARPVAPGSTRFSNANMLTAALARSTSTLNLASLSALTSTSASTSTSSTTAATLCSPALTPILQAAPGASATDSANESNQLAQNIATDAPIAATLASAPVQPSSTVVITKPITEVEAPSSTASARSGHLTGKPSETTQTLAATTTAVAAATPEQPVLTVSALPLVPITVATPSLQQPPPQSSLAAPLAPSTATLGLQSSTAVHGTALSSTPTLPLNTTIASDATPQPLAAAPAPSNQFAQTILADAVALHGTAKAASIPVPALPIEQTAQPASEIQAKTAVNLAPIEPSAQPQTTAASVQTALPTTALQAAATGATPNILITSAASATQPVIPSAAPAKSVVKAGAVSAAASTPNTQTPSSAAPIATAPAVQASAATQSLPAAPRTPAATLPIAASASEHKVNPKPLATDTPAIVSAQPSAPTATSTPSLQTDSKSHLTAMQPQPVALSSPLPDTAGLSTAPSTIVHAPIAITALSTPASLGSGLAQSTTAGVVSAAMSPDTLPHSTLSSSPTTLEVGVSSGTHGWLKIRAELNAAGTVDASLTGTSSTAATKLQSDLPALNSFLQNEKVSVGALTVTAPSATVATLHATAASTFESTAAFTRAATEATNGSSLGANVGADANATGGRAPQQNPQGSPNPAAIPVELRERREPVDIPAGPLASPASPTSYADLTELGGRAASSMDYTPGGSWLNVRA